MSVEEVKTALSAHSASAGTVAGLERLLGLERPSGSGNATPDNAGRKPPVSAKQATRKPPLASSRARKAPNVEVTANATGTLTPRERYALATDVVNTGLRILTSAAKICVSDGASPQDAPTASSTPREALQPRSGNITPKRASRAKPKSTGNEAAPGPNSNPTESNLCIAQCTSAAFSFLRSVNYQKLGVREPPKLQLETGTLAFAAKLIALRYESLAVRELRTVKRSLYRGYGEQDLSRNNIRKQFDTAPVQPVKETLASLLRLDIDLREDQEAINATTTYQAHVVRLISITRKPAVIEEATQYLDVEVSNSPTDLLQRHAKIANDKSKVARQLETLSQIILGLCPSASSSKDVQALDTSAHASPSAIFQLQTIALRTRQIWWRIANHQTDIMNELLEPFLRCAMAFLRRCSGLVSADAVYQQLVSAWSSLGPVGLSAATCSLVSSIHSLLCKQAEHAERTPQALQWAETAVRDCSSLEAHHARKVSASVQCIVICSRLSKTAIPSRDLTSVTESLRSKLSGSSADYDVLLVDLAALLKTVCIMSSSPQESDHWRLATLAAGFSFRYARAYPERNLTAVLEIIECALRYSRSTEQLLSWITGDAAKIYIRAGVLTAVAEIAQKKPTGEVWAVSTAALSLSRILRALLLSSIRSYEDKKAIGIFDDDQLPLDERGMLLELQLDAINQLTPKTKYHSVLQVLLKDVLQRLAIVYTADRYPIRRARVALAVLQLREASPHLIPPHQVLRWQNLSIETASDLGDDTGLSGYVEDLKAGISLAKAFAQGRPTFEQLRSALSAWQVIIMSCKGGDELRTRIDDPAALAKQLRMVADYLSMLGEEHHCLSVLRILVRLEVLCKSGLSSSLVPACALARCYMDLGCAEKAGHVLKEAKEPEKSATQSIRCRLASAEYLLAIEDVERCKVVLSEAKLARDGMADGELPREHKREYELLHAQAWLTHSRLMMQSGSPHDALMAAKWCVKVLNSMWSAQERAYGGSKPSPIDETKEGDTGDASVDGLSKGISKLNLKSGSAQAVVEIQHKTVKGATFWRLTPVIIKALLHLSDMYVHHGLFAEANYYSERAVGIAESVGSTAWLSRTKSHRARLLVLAGKTEEAELCLAHDEDLGAQGPSLAAVERLRAEAAVKAEEGSTEDALVFVEKAKRMADDMQKEKYIMQIEQLLGPDGLDKMESAALPPEIKSTEPARKKAVQAQGKKATAKITAASAPRRPQKTRPVQPVTDELRTNRLLSRLSTDILKDALKLRLKLGQDVNDVMPLTRQLPKPCTDTSMLEHLDKMAQVGAILEMDVTMNVLTESTLSMPALLYSYPIAGNTDPSPPATSASTIGKTRTTKTKQPAIKKAGPNDDIIALLQAARDVLFGSDPDGVPFSGTVEAHLRGSSLSKSSSLLAAVCDPDPTLFRPSHEAVNLDFPKMKALQCERKAVHADHFLGESGDPLMWPADPVTLQGGGLSAAGFQRDYVDIIPTAWTAVSLSLNDDATELYAVRYRTGQQPLIIRLPFSRHKPDGVEDEAFDYEKGKAELQDIIRLSDYSCHSNQDLGAKGAKSNWWSEREVLDRRMHELLINIESIWLGGFRSVLSLSQSDDASLSGFRTSFEAILARHLPSRHAAKGKSKWMTFDNQILELFTGLGDEQDGSIDLDEPLADLLYFAVDMLQFRGERNAYDEIDFDSMAVDMLDALRSYHESRRSAMSEGQHLVLMLDRRLQAFPWESMPCLENISVSRVGSMLSLRECIVAMRPACNTSTLEFPNEGEGCHLVERVNGTYILNPSSDLPGTQKMLSPALTILTSDSDNSWAAIVNEAPTEQRFSSWLSTSPILLYFGHGAGSQYIRPRAIKRLESCSEVVWLMGCSSGSVTEHGRLEPSAVPLSYLLAGSKDYTNDNHRAKQLNRKCMSVVATLWDVTDKDIDRFSLAVGEEWGLWPASSQSKLPAKTPRKRQVVAAPSTPQRVPKTPKTPKVHKTPAPTKTPGRSSSRIPEEGAKKRSLVDAVTSSRDACYLRYLNGAAPVVYGIPTYLGDR